MKKKNLKKKKSRQDQQEAYTRPQRVKGVKGEKGASQGLCHVLAKWHLPGRSQSQGPASSVTSQL